MCFHITNIRILLVLCYTKYHFFYSNVYRIIMAKAAKPILLRLMGKKARNPVWKSWYKRYYLYTNGRTFFEQKTKKFIKNGLPYDSTPERIILSPIYDMRFNYYLLLAIIIGTGCSTTKRAAVLVTPSAPGTPNYAHLDFWAAHPSKQDPADQLPLILRYDSAVDTSVVVFFIHPTTFTADDRTEWNADLADIALNKKTDEKPILYQASAFNDYPVYAPRYRQAHIRAYFTS